MNSYRFKIIPLNKFQSIKNLNHNNSIQNFNNIINKRFNHFNAAPKLSLDDVNPRVIKAEYAVRGLIPNKAEELRKKLLRHPNELPFKQIINANIGNPQQLKQKPITFYRSVLSILQNPSLLNDNHDSSSSINYPQDVKDRASKLLKEIGSVGAYSQSQGSLIVRESIAKFITNRDDGALAHPNDIYLTTGASDAVKLVFEVILNGERDNGVLIPIPQYPLYTAAIALKNSTPIPYYLNESDNWSTDPQKIEELVLSSLKFGIKPKILVVINPGNPTGSVLNQDNIKDILQIAAKYGIVIIADEVYQNNVFEGKKFHSFKKILLELQQNRDEFDNVQLVSLHSSSKGVSGECGQRGGYMELIGFNHEILKLFDKLVSISLCPVVTGQALMELITNPPQKGDPSYELFQFETNSIHESYKSKADALYNAFKQLDNIEVQKPQGAMYLFPKILFNERILNASKELNLQPDEFYCLKLLEQTGICVVPGSGFGQVEGTFHVRTTFLPPGNEWIHEWAKFHQNFFKKFS
ncbi:hypothetical protein WICMUC_003477 [Wickerhamomyces mucosus]|uniref:Glutamate pyruvate transaminase n=1 Tax=Wickerhamomyces mucosus TaxID=1378264 RepID=A0A9P8PMJ8_9ASCO|nr:hypothetical protein WICMUC_003477 [Wickerhamomyces mucosus]